MVGQYTTVHIYHCAEAKPLVKTCTQGCGVYMGVVYTGVGVV